ncbi:MAG: alpha-amylase family glycosyl hydrolase, partial [Collinsella bouchesdurhonensis]|nr:alpha-amylase family glycosyl hydrolase [Collinsella bouchesdurhonensis]
MSKQNETLATTTVESSLAISKDDIYLFGQGTWLGCAEKLGSHPDIEDGTRGWSFAVWAPAVRSVSVVGDFNAWTPGTHPLARVHQSDIWQGFISGLKAGELYKYALETDSGEILFKADPMAVADELPPGTASKLWSLDGYKWNDELWLEQRRASNHMKQPLNIYEVHLGSWNRHGDEPQGEPREDGTYPGPGDPFPAQRGTYYSYLDLAQELVPYAKDMGYTHIEILPITEHPFDGSWGYQTTGYYATTARFGTPQEFMQLVDTAHQAGIGVIMDWVPGGFCADAHGLATFNGHMLYEHEIHPNWGTHKFDFSRPEVVSFLTANILF